MEEVAVVVVEEGTSEGKSTEPLAVVEDLEVRIGRNVHNTHTRGVPKGD